MGIGTIGFSALGADSVKSAFGCKGGVALKTLSFDSLLGACEGSSAVIFTVSQEVPPWWFFGFDMQKAYHYGLFYQEFLIRD